MERMSDRVAYPRIEDESTKKLGSNCLLQYNGIHSAAKRHLTCLRESNCANGLRLPSQVSRGGQG